MKNKLSLFISYSHTDRASCDRIAEILGRDGALDIWYDKGLIPGEVYRRKIADKIKSSDIFVILLSARSTKSDWVLDELEFARSSRRQIIPVWIEDIVLPDEYEMILQRFHGLFWHTRNSDEDFARDFSAILGQPGVSESWQAEAAQFKSELIPREQEEIRRLLEQESQDRFTHCYRPENALTLGKAYFFGVHTDIDFEKARFYFKIAAYNGSPDAEFYLLQMTVEECLPVTAESGMGEIKKSALEKIEALAGGDCVPAKLYMGNVLWYGKYGYAANQAGSAAYYEACARLGSVRAQYMMATNYYDGSGVPQDFDLALMFAHLCLEQKYMRAYRRIGIFHEEGLAAPLDYEKARDYYLEGGRRGDYYCYCRLGDMYMDGRGVERDVEKALEYYREAEAAPVNGQKYCLRKVKAALGLYYEEQQDGVEKAARKYLEGFRLGSAECKEGYYRCMERIQSMEK